jgi:predicted AAA+ superfamily ATPase
MITSIIHNAGKLFSINKFYQDLKSQGYQIGKDNLYEYAAYIEDAYLSFFVGVYDLSVRKAQVNPKKSYAIDPGMIRALTMEYERDLGRVFENIVYLDLRRLGHEVHYYLTSERYKVDFLVKASFGKKKLFQVALEVQDEKTKEREERALEIGMKELGVEGDLITLHSYLSRGIKF